MLFSHVHRKVQFRTQRVPLYYYHNPDVTIPHLCNIKIFQYDCFLGCHAMQSGDTNHWNVANYITWHHTSKSSNLKKSTAISTTQYLYTVPKYTISTQWLFYFLQNYTNIHTHIHARTHIRTQWFSWLCILPLLMCSPQFRFFTDYCNTLRKKTKLVQQKQSIYFLQNNRMWTVQK